MSTKKYMTRALDFVKKLFRYALNLAPAGEVDASSLEFVILAAGKSTRNYPHSKGLPHKSLAPFGSRKVIDEIIRQVVEAGGKHITLVVSNDATRQAFESAFLREPEIEAKFEKKGDAVGLELLKSLYIPDDVEIKYVIQEKPKGTGHAVGLAYESVRKTGRSIVMIWPDDMILADRYALFPEDRVSIYRRAVAKYISEGGRGNLVITRRVGDPKRWGVVLDGYYREKPDIKGPADAGVGFVIFDRRVCDEILKETKALDAHRDVAGLVGGELTFIPALNRVVAGDFKNMRVRTCPMLPSDTYLDCGSIEGYEKTLLYTLLTESKFNRTNFRFLKKIMPKIEKRIDKESKNVARG